METLSAELAARFAAPYARQAAILDGAQAADARVLSAGRRALGDLAELSGLAPEPAELARLLEELDIGLRDEPGAGAVTVSEPLSLRARRVRALVLCGMQEGRFPRRRDPSRSSATPSAASSPRPPAWSCAATRRRSTPSASSSTPRSRARRSASSSRWHDAGDDGEPAVRSLFVDDVASLFGPQLWERRRRRGLGQVGWADGAVGAPSAGAARRSPGPRHRRRRPRRCAIRRCWPRSAGATAWSVSDIEAYAGCPVKWLVDRRLRLGTLEPDAETLLRGAAAHAALERALRRLVRENGGTVLSPDRLPQAREAVEEALEGLAGRIRLSTDSRRVRAPPRRLEVDLLRYLEYAAHAGSRTCRRTSRSPSAAPRTSSGRCACPPAWRSRGGSTASTSRPAAARPRLRLQGPTTTGRPHWVDERKLQVALYLIAVRELLGLQPAGGLYQPLGSRDLRPRGALLEDADPGLDVVGRDRATPRGWRRW